MRRGKTMIDLVKKIDKDGNLEILIKGEHEW